jgi:hypothetical protein
MKKAAFQKMRGNTSPKKKVTSLDYIIHATIEKILQSWGDVLAQWDSRGSRITTMP